jgi:AcrR family transcriptional regulator
MAFAQATAASRPARRRDQQKEQTRYDLAMAAFELAKAHGLSNVRVPQIAEAVGVSPRTFNNYFSSKEAAIVWPNSLGASRLVSNLKQWSADAPVAVAIVGAVTGMYGATGQDGLPDGWLHEFRLMVAKEPTLHGEYLKSAASRENRFASAIAGRIGDSDGALKPLVLAGVATAAERAAILHWVRHEPSRPLVELVRAALEMALSGIAYNGF